MSERITKIVHKGKDIIILDFSGLKEAEMLALFDPLHELAVKERCTRFLIDISDTFTTEKIKAASIASEAYLRERVGQPRNALVGVRGVQRMLANAIERGQYFASSREDALDHLAKAE